MPESAVYNPALVVVAYNRPRSLARLLKAISKAQYSQEVPLVISIDKGDNQDVLKVAQDFEWKFGPKEVIYREENLGLKNHIRTCGDLTERFGSIIMLEDDLFVSPAYYEFSRKALNFYGESERVAGIALYKTRLNNNAKKLPFFSLMDGYDVYFSRMVCSWGQAWTHKMWKGFRAWDKEYTGLREDIRLPNSIVNWKESSWVKIFTQYIIETDKYFVYPQISYTTNFGEVGENFTQLESYFQVNMQLGLKEPNFCTYEDSHSVYDIFYDILPDRLKRMAPELADYDFIVDLYGIKPLEKYSEEFVLTQAPVKNPVMSFGRSLLPFEMNIIQGVEGSDIHLARREEVMRIENNYDPLYAYFYSHLPLKPLSKLASQKLKEKKPFSLIFD